MLPLPTPAAVPPPEATPVRLYEPGGFDEEVAKAETLARIEFVGGSDAPDLMGLEPFGCQRKLFYHKAGVGADYPFFGNRHTVRGRKLEALAAREYMEHTGRTVVRDGRWGAPFKAHPFLSGHLDRRIIGMAPGHAGRTRDWQEGPGVLELKCPAKENFFRIKANGVPLSYVVQLQWYMMLTGWAWGSVAVFNADLMSMLVVDHPRDQEVITILFKEAVALHGRVEDYMEDRVAGVEDNDPDLLLEKYLPPRLAVADRRCATCPWRTKCQGYQGEDLDRDEDVGELALEPDPSLAPHVAAYKDIYPVYKEAGDQLEQVKAELKHLMAGRRAVDAGNGRVFVTEVKVKEKVVKGHTQHRLRVKPV